MIKHLTFSINVSDSGHFPSLWFQPEGKSRVLSEWTAEIKTTQRAKELLEKLALLNSFSLPTNESIEYNECKIFLRTKNILTFDVEYATGLPPVEMEYDDAIELFTKYHDWLDRYEKGLIAGLQPIQQSTNESTKEGVTSKSGNIYDLKFMVTVSQVGQHPYFVLKPEETGNVISNWAAEYASTQRVEELLGYIRLLNTLELPTKERIESNECKIYLKARNVLVFDIEYATELPPVDMEYDDAIELFTKYHDWLDRYEKGLIAGLQPVRRY